MRRIEPIFSAEYAAYTYSELEKLYAEALDYDDMSTRLGL